MSTLDHIGQLRSSLARKSKAAAWASLASACAAWAFDAMDLQIFTLVLFPSISELVQSTDPGIVARAGGLIVACKLVALGSGGIAFGIAADRVGRAKTMIITVLIYSIFTGLSGLAQNWWQLLILQACAGIGIGGEWAAGAALVAETWSERTRARALVIMQMSFAIGFFLAALLNLMLGSIGWRYVFAAGAAPAAIALLVRMAVPEPQRWLAVRHQARNIGDPRDSAIQLFRTLFVPPIRSRTIVGVLIASAMMIGAFGAATLLPIWIRGLVGPDNAAFAVAATSQCFMLINVGAVFGYLTLILLSDAVGRRWSYFLIALGCAAANLLMFSQIKSLNGLLWFSPIFGFFAVGGFGSFAIYLPELFPTRIRASGQGFCWNAARILTAAGPLTAGAIVGAFGSAPIAGVALTAIYSVGLTAIWFGPETQGLPLQD